jgi:Fe-S-cluster containining protein
MVGDKREIEAYIDDRVLRTLSQHRCVGCGACCRWRGQVLLYAEDIKTIASEMSLSREQFLICFCKIVWWDREDGRQYRIALTRKGVPGACVFLHDSLCTIHKFKPLQCKAGPAGWSWIASPEKFWHYVDRSPSFRHVEGTMTTEEANRWFLATRSEEFAVSQASSLLELAAILQFSEEVLGQLPLVEYKEN